MLMIFSVFGGTMAFAGTAAANAPDEGTFAAGNASADSTVDADTTQNSAVIITDLDFDTPGNVANVTVDPGFGTSASGITAQDVSSVRVVAELANGDQVVRTNDSFSSFPATANFSDTAAASGDSVTGITVTATVSGSASDGDVLDNGIEVVAPDGTTFGGSSPYDTAGTQTVTPDTGFISGTLTDGQTGDSLPGETVSVYEDTNNNGQVDPGTDLLVKNVTANNNGIFTAEVAPADTGAGDNGYLLFVQRPGFETFDSQPLDVTPGQTTTQNIVLKAIGTPTDIEVLASQPASAVVTADGQESITYFVQVTGTVGNQQNVPLNGTSVDAAVDTGSNIDFDAGSAPVQNTTVGEVTLPDGSTANGVTTFTVSSTQQQTATLNFTVTADNSISDTADATFGLEAGKAAITGQVVDYDATGGEKVGLSDATVWAVSDSRFGANEQDFSVSTDPGETVYFRLIDNETGEVVDAWDYALENSPNNFDSNVGRMAELNQTDRGVGSGFFATDTDDNGEVEFAVAPLEPGEYYLQVSDSQADAAREPSTTATTPFTNVSQDPIFTTPNNITAAATSERAANSGANPVTISDGDGDFILNNLQDGSYYVIAERVGYDRDYLGGLNGVPIGPGPGAGYDYDKDNDLYRISQPLILEQRDIEPNAVNITQSGVHPPLAETGGAPDPDQITPFNDTSDDTFQQVPRDGSVDVIEVSAGATSFQGDEVPVDTNVTVELNESFDGQFLGTVLSGEVVSNDQENATITVSTGSDGEATVLLETEQNASSLSAQKTATLETDSTVTDSSNVTFVGTVVYETGSLSGIVTNEDNEPLPNSVVYVEEFEDNSSNTYTVEPVNAQFSPEDRQDALDSEFVVTDETTNESVTVTGEELRNFEVDQEFTRVSVRNVSSVSLLTFPSDGAQYTLPRVPATDDGVTYTRVAGVQFGTGTAGVGDSDPVRVGFTQEANIVIVGAQPVSAEFAVSDLNPQNVTVTQGDNITVTANVTNDGEVSSTQNVEFSVGGDVVATQTVSLDANETTTVTFENVSTAGLAPGEYEHGVFTNDDEETATLTVEAGSGNGNNGVVADYDTNGQAGIQPDEAQNAIGDLNNGELTPGQVQSIIAALNS